ncbi:MAG: DUF2283 domain-containing protein [Rubrobacteraceae bacterium]
MKVVYTREDDAMAVTLRTDRRYAESEEVAPGVVLDFDEDGNVLSIEIYAEASEKVDVSVLMTEGLPTESKPSTAGASTVREG